MTAGSRDQGPKARDVQRDTALRQQLTRSAATPSRIPSVPHRPALDVAAIAGLAEAAATPSRIPYPRHRLDLDAPTIAELTGRLQAEGQVSEAHWVGGGLLRLLLRKAMALLGSGQGSEQHLFPPVNVFILMCRGPWGSWMRWLLAGSCCKKQPRS